MVAMRRLLPTSIALVAVLVVAVFGFARGADAKAPSQAGAAPPDPSVLAVLGSGSRAVLARVDPVSLRPMGKRVRIGSFAGPEAVSPDGSTLALGSIQSGSVALRLVDLRSMRVVATIGLRDVSDLSNLAWVGTRRLVATSVFSDVSVRLTAVDPRSRRVVWRRDASGSLVASAAGASRVVLALAPFERIGPTRLVAVDAAGRLRSVALDRIASGFRQDQGSGTFRGEQRHPGLAVDPAGNRAFVVGAGEPVAEVDLATMGVAYHGGTRAPAKLVDGPVRAARWLGNGLIAVTGYDGHTSTDPGGNPQETSTPAGLTLIDTRDWSSRVVDRSAGAIVVADDTIVTYGAGFEGAGSAVGVSGYSLDGTPRFHVLARETIDWLQAGGGMAYAWGPVNRASRARLSVVDLASGAVVRTATINVSRFGLLAAS